MWHIKNFIINIFFFNCDLKKKKKLVSVAEFQKGVSLYGHGWKRPGPGNVAVLVALAWMAVGLQSRTGSSEWTRFTFHRVAS